MLRAKEYTDKTPATIVIFRLLQGLFFVYSLAILGLALIQTTENNDLRFQEQLIFGLSVAIPVVLGAGFSFLALIFRYFCTIAVFFCAVLVFSFLGLPLMTAVFFPMHLLLFFLAAVYALTGFQIMRYTLSSPLPAKK